jgi:uncharacterized integral membrane protein (TIGR00698 family)
MRTFPVILNVSSEVLRLTTAWKARLPTSKTIFFVCLILTASGAVSPPVALVAGVIFGLTLEHPFRSDNSALAKVLLQVAVVALGFGMNLGQVVHAGRSGFLYTAGSILLTAILGLSLGRLLAVDGKASYLITAGTAICGGSAIAALAPITGAGEEEISVAMGTVFLLNSVALLLFPAIGWGLHLSQKQFGLWAALAIHDTSSVVGASAKYGAQALIIGTTVKLARALWIVPASLLTAAYMRNAWRSKSTEQGVAKVKMKIPWFILYFCLASVVTTYVPRFAAEYKVLNGIGRVSLVATLFVIGSGLSRSTLAKVGVRPLVQGVMLWVVVSTVSLFLIYHHWISI